MITDVDLNTESVHFHGKGAKDRRVRFGPKTARALTKYLRARDKHKGAALPNLWLADRGAAHLPPNGIKIRLKRLGHAAGVPDVHAHRWRHSFAHEWKRAGGDTGDLMLLLGWTSEDMPRHYGPALPPNAPWRPSSASASVNIYKCFRALGGRSSSFDPRPESATNQGQRALSMSRTRTRSATTNILKRPLRPWWTMAGVSIIRGRTQSDAALVRGYT
jgi:hypothetical protein